MALNNSFQPVSWNGEPITTDKLNQMCNNTQWIFDRSPRIRYTTPGGTVDIALKVLAGKTPYSATSSGVDNEWVTISFGSFFSVGSSPVITASAEPQGYRRRVGVTVSGLDFNQVDWNGFQAIVWDAEVNSQLGSYLDASGFIHWTAIGY